MADSPKPVSWWHTLPGVLTATATVITAVTGLLVALVQLGVLERSNAQPPSTEAGTVTVTGSPAGADTGISAGQLPAASAAGVAGRQTLALPTPSEFRANDVIYQILSVELEPYNAESRALKLTVRLVNNGRYDEPLGYDRSVLRLLVDDLPRAPVESPVLAVEGESAKEGDFVFLVPAATRQVVLQVRHGDEVTRIPIDLATLKS